MMLLTIFHEIMTLYDNLEVFFKLNNIQIVEVKYLEAQLIENDGTFEFSFTLDELPELKKLVKSWTRCCFLVDFYKGYLNLFDTCYPRKDKLVKTSCKNIEYLPESYVIEKYQDMKIGSRIHQDTMARGKPYLFEWNDLASETCNSLTLEDVRESNIQKKQIKNHNAVVIGYLVDRDEKYLWTSSYKITRKEHETLHAIPRNITDLKTWEIIPSIKE